MKIIKNIPISIILIFFISLPLLSHAGQTEGMKIPKNNLEVVIDIPNSRIKGISRILVRGDKEVTIHRGSLRITSIMVDGRPVSFQGGRKEIKIGAMDGGTIEIRFEGTFQGGDALKGHERGLVENIIDERGVSLTGLWYPFLDRLSFYRLKAILPRDYVAISEAEDIRREIKDKHVEFYFTFPHPLEKINLIATKRYRIIRKTFKDIEIYAYFFPEDMELVKTYLTYTMRYLDLYKELIGRYPYKRFSIVENFLPTGFSMPTFTLLGQSVVRLPFIAETSLGHEILHQWFGNLVYVDYDSGNWSEGLTTYLADHLYEEKKGRGWEYRKQALIDYESYVRDKNEIPLREFKIRVDSASRAIGYGKAAMVFHMLREICGERIFFAALKDFVDRNSFHNVSWSDLRRSFEQFFRKDLSWFFHQWIDDKGIPELLLDNVNVREGGKGFELTFDIVQKGTVYRLPNVKITIFTKGGVKEELLVVEKERNNFTIPLHERPERIVIDRDYDIARKLIEDEIPPTIARLIEDERLIVALPVKKRELYKTIINTFKDRGAIMRDAAGIKESDIRKSSMVILGLDNPLIDRLYGRVGRVDAGFYLLVRENPWNAKKVIGIFNGRSKDEVDAAFRKVSHYGKYSRLIFEKGRNLLKEIKESQRGMVVEFKKKAAVVDISSIKRMSDVLKEVEKKKIIYIGEMHDVFAHHAVQLDLIKGLYRRNKNIAIGMEMFQRPFQKTLDDFIAGRIDERRFLKESEYFKRWGFDYNLYKPILDFARAEKIPVIALNIRREIIEKVSKGGIDSLSEEERKKLPEERDFSDRGYRERLKRVFRKHKDWKKKNFDYFYQSQILWDETMSESVDSFLRNNPDRQFIALAGKGHLEFGSGIPRRTFRRNGYDYAIILIDGEVKKGIADYVIFPSPVEGITSPKLMVFLNEEKEKIKIVGFPDKSISEKAGLKVGDFILSIDGIPVKGIEDIKIQLFFKKKGEKISVKVLREGPLGDKEMEFVIEL